MVSTNGGTTVVEKVTIHGYPAKGFKDPGWISLACNVIEEGSRLYSLFFDEMEGEIFVENSPWGYSVTVWITSDDDFRFLLFELSLDSEGRLLKSTSPGILKLSPRESSDQ